MKEEIIALYLTEKYTQTEVAKMVGLKKSVVNIYLMAGLGDKVVKKILYNQKLKRWQAKKPKK